MRLFIHILISVVLAGVALRLLEVPVEWGLKRNADSKLNYVERQPVNADVVLHGDCHMEGNLNPQLLQRATGLSFYNLAQGNSNFADNYLFLRHYLAHQQKPKMVLVYVGPASFDSTFGSAFNTYRFARLLHDPEVRSLAAAYDPHYQKLAYLPFMRYAYYSNFTYYRALKGWLDSRHLTAGTIRQADGYLAPGHYWETAGYQFRTDRVEVAWSALDERYLHKIIDLAKEHQVRLGFVELPVYHKTREMLLNYDQRMAQIETIAQKTGVPFYRITNDALQADSLNYYSAFNVTARGIGKMNEVVGAFIKDSILPVLQQHSNHYSQHTTQ